MRKKSFNQLNTVNIVKRKSKMKIGLALSGGGARGFAHIGALKALEEYGLPIHCVAGTSIGSFAGALYCAGFTSSEIEEFSLTIKLTDIKTSKILFLPSPSAQIGITADRMLQGITFDQLKIPFSAVAVNLKSGEEVMINSGKVSDAISASCAVPVFFLPFVQNNMILVDGGLLNTIPSDVCRRMGAEVVIAVDLNSTRGQGTNSARILDVMGATWRVVMKSTAYKGYMNSDLIIEPQLEKYSSTTLNQDINQMIEDGYNATVQLMPQIFQLTGVK
ncbi:MAG: patatin-like phospholipase family protein [Clostridia bacterium]|nr:patatin-like phospholipase family protein [Clostridia bacterium]